MTDVSAIVVAYRPGPQLARAVTSVLGASGVSVEVVIVNNDPRDRLPRTIGAELGQTLVIEAGGNIGFCAAVNLALSDTSSPYVLLLNPDAWIEPAYLERVVGHMVDDSTIGSAAGRVLRSTQTNHGTQYIDSLGIEFLPGRRPTDRGHGEPDDGQRSGVEEVFGVTGAAAVLRRSALDACAVAGEVLPVDFFMYYDDVDLAWRLRGLGYRALIDHSAIAHHGRQTAGGVNQPGRGLAKVLASARRHTARPDYFVELTWSNLRLMLVRNDEPDRLLSDMAFMALRQAPADLLSIAQRPLLAARARSRFLRLLPGALEQRRRIRATRTGHVGSLDGWIH